MTVSLLATAVTALAALVLLARSVTIVPQGFVYVTRRFGRLARALEPGVRLRLPVAERLAYRFPLREETAAFPPHPVVTRDQGRVLVEVLVYERVADPLAAASRWYEYTQQREHVVHTTLQRTARRMTQAEALGAYEELDAALLAALTAMAEPCGMRITRVETKRIEPDQPPRVASGTGDGAARQPRRAETAAADVPGTAPLRDGDPERIGPFTPRARLGEGGMGTVYLAASAEGGLVALKVVQERFAADPAFRRRFAREAEAARRVGGEYTATVVGADPEGDPPWLATEFIPGPTLRELLERHGPLPVRSLLALTAGVGRALVGIHACGIIHRDLKPSNIIVSATGPRVIDFGIARPLDGTALTQTHHVVGTPGFLAPEQLTGAPVTPACDVYAFGMVVCHAAGVAPFEDGEERSAALRQLPSALAPLISRCLEHDPAARPSPAELRDAFAPDRTADWLPPAARTLVDLHARSTVDAVPGGGQPPHNQAQKS